MAARLLSGNDYSTHLSKQTAKGAIDNTPAFDEFRRTEGKARVNTAYVQSTEVKSNRQARESLRDTVDYSAELSSEFTKQTIEYMIYAIQGNEVVNTATLATIASTATGFVDSGVAAFTNYEVGDYFFPSGFTDSTIDGTYRITVKNSNGDIETSPAPPAIEAEGASVTIDMNKTSSASDIPFFTVQTRVVDESAPGQIDYQTFYDGWIGDASFEIGETGIVTTTFNITAEEKTADNLIIVGQTDNPIDDSDVISAIGGIVKFWVNGVDSDCTVKSMGFEYSNNLVEDRAAACPGAKYANGDVTLSGAVVARLPVDNSQVWRDRYNAGTVVALAAEIDHGNGDVTVIEVPEAKITEHEIPDGSNVVANSEMTYTAQEDSRGFTTVIYRNWQ